MASPSTTTPDTLVTLKVAFDGGHRKFKLPLRDLSANSLEDKLRTLLAISPASKATIERYSDSAASYVVLDPSNVPVYKQLYRAAKAKQKLKLRVTVQKIEQEKGPKPVTVEDEPETPDFAQTKPEAPLISTASSVAAGPTSTQSTLPSSTDNLRAQLRNAVEYLAQGTTDVMRDIGKLESTFAAQSPESPPLESEPASATRIPVRFGPCTRSRLSIKSCPSSPIAVCCNSCDKTIPDSHYHCSTCDDGDFDLCQDCVDKGITCHGTDHWLIKRFVKDSQIFTSTTEKIAPKPKLAALKAAPPTLSAKKAAQEPAVKTWSISHATPVRTCNSCVLELPEFAFLHCTHCEDFDLCTSCFVKDKHGHNPKHGFVPAVEGMPLTAAVSERLSPGRNQKHHAICDGCDKYIFGIRHKCLDCPDWDYCGDCIANASFIHPNHRFVPIYEQLPGIRRRSANHGQVHYGICCDGPLCSTTSKRNAYIVGDRYKCAVCHDTDFCANCEASPANTHNKTHPLIKFKTPVRHVSVTTTGEHGDGQRMAPMGDRLLRPRNSTSSRATETTLANQTIAATPVQTVVDVQPVEVCPKIEAKLEDVKSLQTSQTREQAVKSEPGAGQLVAVFERDTVADGSTFPPNHVFEQTWVLRNAGTVPWPAGCTVKFTGGDYMGHVDHKHPAGIKELVSASESTVCYDPLYPGQEFPFTVLLRTPAYEGKVISYWRLTTKDGIPFGRRLWCDVDVKAPEAPEVKEEVQEEPREELKEEVPAPEVKTEEPPQSSQMIFPKLEDESPASSVHEEVKPEPETREVEDELDDFEDCADVEFDESDEGFMTDEEYDILDASDEECFDGQQKKVGKN